MIFLESLSKMSVVYSELENFSHRPHDAVGDFYLFVQIIEKSLSSVRLGLMSAIATVDFEDSIYAFSKNFSF